MTFELESHEMPEELPDFRTTLMMGMHRFDLKEVLWNAKKPVTIEGRLLLQLCNPRNRPDIFKELQIRAMFAFLKSTSSKLNPKHCTIIIHHKMVPIKHLNICLLYFGHNASMPLKNVVR